VLSKIISWFAKELNEEDLNSNEFYLNKWVIKLLYGSISLLNLNRDNWYSSEEFVNIFKLMTADSTNL
jgi:hypothetical protein